MEASAVVLLVFSLSCPAHERYLGGFKTIRIPVLHNEALLAPLSFHSVIPGFAAHQRLYQDQDFIADS